MLTVLMHGAGATTPLGPATEICLRGKWLVLECAGVPIVEQLGHQWIYGAVSFDQISIQQPVFAWFGDAGRAGPFTGLWLSQGQIQIGKGSGPSLAIFDPESETWSMVGSILRVPEVRIAPPATDESAGSGSR